MNHTAFVLLTLSCFYSTHIVEVPYNKTIQMVFTNIGDRSGFAHHPIHLHGTNFAVLKVGHAEYDPVTGYHSDQNDDLTCNNR